MEIRNTKNQLFRYRKANEFSLDELENSYIYFPSSSELNDPFDASHNMLSLTSQDSEMEKLYNELLTESPNEKTKAYIKNEFENKPDKLRELVKGRTKNFISTYGIACFTVTPLHVVLWAYYANHEGICIQYDTTLDEPFFKGMRRVEYVNNFEKINFEPITNPQVYEDLFYKKLNLWEKEFEIRIVKYGIGEHKVNPESVRSIILGIHAKEEYIEKVIEIVKRKYKHAILYKTEVMTESVGFSFIPYNL